MFSEIFKDRVEAVMLRRFPNIPEYNLADSLNNRIVALARLEKFLDERTITREVIDDLKKVAELAQKNNERRIVVMANLIIDQCLKYFE